MIGRYIFVERRLKGEKLLNFLSNLVFDSPTVFN